MSGVLMIEVAFAQGLYFVITGIWPLVHMGSFLKVTGPKTDLWLVQTVGAMLIAIGAGLLVAGLEPQIPLPLLVVAMISAAGLCAVEVTYVRRQTISRIYLLDAWIEAGFLISWSACFVNR
jgi:hypothetical protein